MFEIQDRGNHDVYVYPIARVSVPVTKDPTEHRERDAEELVHGALTVAGELNLAVNGAARNEDLSAKGLHKQRVDATLGAVIRIGNLAERAQNARADAVSAEVAFYAVPKLDPTDASGSILDMEIRSGVKAMSGDERKVLLAQAGDGRNHHILRALKRSPLPTGIPAEDLDAAWKASARAAQPEASSALEKRLQSTSWSLRHVRLAAEAARRIANLPNDDLLAIFDRAGNSQAPQLFGFAANAMEFWKARHATRAAA